MWLGDPEITYQVARVEQEMKVVDHLRRKAQRGQRPGSSMGNALLGQVGDVLVGAGEWMRRRAQVKAPLARNGLGY